MYDTTQCTVLFGMVWNLLCSVLQQYYTDNYCTTVTLVHQDYLDAINVSVLYVITGSIFLVDSGNKNNLRVQFEAEIAG